ncbi:MAG: protein kinase [Nanoarchaeota archaeon]|nr:protein kinase [Nanoarchaeota archaeon]
MGLTDMLGLPKSNMDTFFKKDLVGRRLIFEKDDQGEVLSEAILEERIGMGGMAGVMRATWEEHEVAIKILYPYLYEDKDGDRDKNESWTRKLQARFIEEGRALFDFKYPEPHPNIIDVYKYGCDDNGLYYIIMKYVDNAFNLTRDCLDLDIETKCNITAKVANALHFAHKKGVIHRDIKPDNILVNFDKNEVKLIDWGIAKVDDLGKTAADEFLGTPYYASPEQFSSRQLTAQSDLFSLGATLYYILTGEWPFTGKTGHEIGIKACNPEIYPTPPSVHDLEIPLELDEVILRALATDPHERFEDGYEFEDALLSLGKKRLSKTAVGKWWSLHSGERKSKELRSFIRDVQKKPEYNLLEGEPSKEVRKFIDECLKIEGEELEKLGLEASTRKMEARERHLLTSKKERWLEVVDRYQDETNGEMGKSYFGKVLRLFGLRKGEHLVLKRKKRLKALHTEYADLSYVYPNLKRSRDSIERRIDWEVNRQHFLNIKDPLSFWKKYGWYFGAAAVAGVIIFLGGYIGLDKFGKYRERKGYEKQANELRLGLEGTLEKDFQEIDFQDTGDAIEKLKRLYVKSENEGFLIVARGLQDSLDNKKEEKRLVERREQEEEKLQGILDEALGKIASAYGLIEKGLLNEADKLREETEEMRYFLDRKRAETLVGKLKKFEEDAGPTFTAFQAYRPAKETYETIQKEYAELEKRLNKEDFFSWKAIGVLASKISIKGDVLAGEGVKSVFGDSSEYGELVENVKNLKRSLGGLDLRSSSVQFKKVKESLDELKKNVEWLADNYYLEEAVAKDKEVAGKKALIETLLGNVNPDHFAVSDIFTEEPRNLIDEARGTMTKILESYDSTKVQKVAELRKKAETDNEVAFELGKMLLFEKERYDLARPYFEKGGKEAKPYLRVANLIEKIKDPKHHLMLRNGLLSGVVDEYHSAVGAYLGAEQLDAIEVYLALSEFGKIGALKEVVAEANGQLNPLISLSSQVAKLAEAIEYEPKPEEGKEESEKLKSLRRDYGVARNKFLGAAGNNQALRKVEEAAREYLAGGAKIVDPHVVWHLADNLFELGRKEDAKKYYEACLSSHLLNKDDKKIIKEELKSLGK